MLEMNDNSFVWGAQLQYIYRNKDNNNHKNSINNRTLCIQLN